MRPGCVDYKRFSDVIEESFTQACLERAPLVVPMQHIPTQDCERNFLNFDERLCLSIAMQKLSKKPDLQMNLMSVFKVNFIIQFLQSLLTLMLIHLEILPVVIIVGV